MGGHSTLFYEAALAELQFAEIWRTGCNVGDDVAVQAGRPVAVTVGARLMPAPTDAPVTARLYNEVQIIFDVPLTRVQETIGARPARQFC